MIVLEKWIKHNLDVINHEKLEIYERNSLTELVYSIAMDQLIKQVSIQCKERGALLDTVWANTIELIKSHQGQPCKINFEGS